jgi:hypothetical protein
MNPRKYATNAERQAEYRQAVKLDRTVPEYRAYIAAGGKPAPYVPNKGWDSLDAARARLVELLGTSGERRVSKTHLPKDKYATACGLFIDRTLS